MIFFFLAKSNFVKELRLLPLFSFYFYLLDLYWNVHTIFLTSIQNMHLVCIRFVGSLHSKTVEQRGMWEEAFKWTNVSELLNDKQNTLMLVVV